MSFGIKLKQAQLKIELISFPLNLIVFKNKNYIFLKISYNLFIDMLSDEIY